MRFFCFTGVFSFRCLFYLLLLAALPLQAGYSSMSPGRIMMRMHTQSLHQGKRVDVEAEMYFQSVDGRMLTRYISPLQQIMITNNKGELAIYDENANTVYRDRSLEYSSENNLIYYFLSGRLQDLGLSQLGFQPIQTEYIERMVKTTWFPPQAYYHLFTRIELVHEDFLPIYAAYYDARGDLVKKVYYASYREFPELILPMLITEFNYLPGGDSIINRLRFSDVRINQQAESAWFQFRIPENAKLLD